ncbi:hypothetical protein OL239_13325 [Arthrobacter sp. ATA002]|uniref:hypothetical protein n=1 Tax=Arthrobacter sp. ATA002 TaxID=2991715 RepID=UPI0022A776D6|nr:hypothetical protein [Arthrobacter sp. ATA002]WAP50933.1 hypothetical protein OL239_13325 [Arthrobacter sp. ATA002]
MKKPLIALTAAALLLAASGCTPDSGGSTDAGTAEPTAAAASPTAGASTSPSPSPTAADSASPGAPASPDSSAGPSGPATSAAIADGFPIDIVSLMPGSTALSTSFEETPELFTASLTASTSSSAEEILAHYEAEFESQGFTSGEAGKQGTTTVQTFVRSGGTDTANVAVVPRDGSFTYTASINTLPESAQ